MLTFDEFKTYMERIKEYQENEEKVDSALKSLSPDFGGFHIEAFDLTIEMLKKLMKDNYEWIDYYIYETNWGTAFNEPCVYDANENPIPFKTLEDVYNMILSEKEE